jgi:hypothetical protein
VSISGYNNIPIAQRDEKIEEPLYGISKVLIKDTN